MPIQPWDSLTAWLLPLIMLSGACRLEDPGAGVL